MHTQTSQTGSIRKRIVSRVFLTSVSILTALLISGCGAPEHDLSALPKVTLSADLQATYDLTCANCHENPATGSPQTGDLEQWQIIFNKPVELVMDRAINGFQGMPPLGQCFECSQEALETLVHYMSRPAS